MQIQFRRFLKTVAVLIGVKLRVVCHMYFIAMDSDFAHLVIVATLLCSHSLVELALGTSPRSFPFE